MRFLIETRRLGLREMSLDDLDFVAAMLDDQEVMRFYPRRYTRDEARSWIERMIDRYRRDGHALWLVIDRATGAPVGQVGLVTQQVAGVAEREIGYLIHRPFWRQGLATEAAAAVRDFAFERFGAPRVISLIRPVNAPSQGVARKLGMRPRPRAVQHGGYAHLVFELPRDGWRPTSD